MCFPVLPYPPEAVTTEEPCLRKRLTEALTCSSAFPVPLPALWWEGSGGKWARRATPSNVQGLHSAITPDGAQGLTGCCDWNTQANCVKALHPWVLLLKLKGPRYPPIPSYLPTPFHFLCATQCIYWHQTDHPRYSINRQFAVSLFSLCLCECSGYCTLSSSPHSSFSACVHAWDTVEL